MHMADALISPSVGLAGMAVSSILIVIASKKISQQQQNKETSKTAMMGLAGAFIFAAQMINFTIPGTGSSGHLGGGLLLAILLGSWPAFFVMASVLVIQCLLFSDGGLLALGLNIFNLGFFPAFIAYPFIFKPIAGDMKQNFRNALASLSAGIIGLVLGAFFVVIETCLSGISDLPFETFAFFMLPIHVAIGFVEGLVTWGVLFVVLSTNPSLVQKNEPANTKLKLIFAVSTLIVAGILSWFASTNPDGLEWSIAKVTKKEELKETPSSLLKTSASGLIGAISVLVLAAGSGFLISKTRKLNRENN